MRIKVQRYRQCNALCEIELTPPFNLAIDILKEIPLLVALSNFEAYVVEPENGVRHGTTMLCGAHGAIYVACRLGIKRLDGRPFAEAHLSGPVMLTAIIDTFFVLL